jgi:outer membrane protein assembly factor BamA
MNEVEEGIRHVYSSGLFERVTTEVLDRAGKRVLLLEVKERRFSAVELGARYEREMGGEGFLELVDENLLGTGNRAALRLQKGSRRERYGVRFSTDRIFKSYFTYSLDASLRRGKIYLYDGQAQVGEFETERYGGIIALGQHIYRLGAASVEARAERVELSTISGRPVDEGTDIRALILRFRMDTLNRWTFPTSGSLHHAWVTLNGKIFGGHRAFVMGYTSLESYYTVGGVHTFRPREDSGWGWGCLSQLGSSVLGRTLRGYTDRWMLYG